MKLLAIDPSSSCSGYAVMSDERTLIECGKLKPTRAKDGPNTRIRTMVNEALQLIAEHQPDWVVVEDTSGKVARRHGGGGGAGLAIYGKAVGWFICQMEQRMPGRVTCVVENLWTRGVSKPKRQAFIASLYRPYDPKQDTGGDVADAIGLGRWWFVVRPDLSNKVA